MAGKAGAGRFSSAAQACFSFRLFELTGVLIARRPFCCLALSAVLFLPTIGLLRFEITPKAKEGFTPAGARARYEDAVYDEFYGDNGERDRLFVVVSARDGRSMLRLPHFSQLVHFARFMAANFSVEYDSRRVVYEQLAGVDSARIIPRHLSLMQRKLEVGELPTHPRYAPFGVPIQTAIYFSNFTKAAGSDRLLASRLVLLTYKAAPISRELDAASKKWMLALFKWSSAPRAEFPLLQVHPVSEAIIASELVSIAPTLIGYFFTGIALMALFVDAAVLATGAVYGRLDICGGLVVSTAALLSPAFTVGASFGFISLLGYQVYPTTMLMIPFLVLAIGVDDALLMYHAWARRRAAEAAETRMGAVLAEVGPSIAITSLTNCLAFGVGATSSTPIVHAFCLTTAVAMALDFIFELLFFGAVLALVSRRAAAAAAAAAAADSPRHAPLLRHLDALCRRYCRFVASNGGLALAVATLAALWTVSALGILRMEVIVNMDKVLPRRSQLRDTNKDFFGHIWHDFYLEAVIINSPPDLNNKTALNRCFSMIDQLNSGRFSNGKEMSFFWLEDYMPYWTTTVGFWDSVDFSDTASSRANMSYDMVPDFLSHPSFEHWNNTVRWSRVNGSVRVERFSVVIGFSMRRSWYDLIEALPQWRATVAAFGELNATVWDFNGNFVDAIGSLGRHTTQAAALTLCCMAVLCALFVPSVVGTVCALVSIASIAAGVTGCMSWWQLDLDPITMIICLMSIGFSVDFTAHTIYHYQKFAKEPCGGGGGGEKERRVDAMAKTLGSIGWPVMQAAASTLLCMCPQAFNGEYAPTAFVKAVTLIVLLGVLHGFFVLPAVLAKLIRLPPYVPVDHELDLHSQTDLHPS